MNEFLSRQKHDYFAQTDRGETHRNISRFYNETEAAVAVLEGKYMQPAINLPGIQHLLTSRGMVVNALQKVHTKICRKLRSSPNLCSPWRGEFTMDIPRETFAIIAEHVIQRNSYGHTYKETAACIDISVENMRKARFIFNYINAETYIIPKEDMLQKKLQITSGGSQERSEVVINYNKPLQLKYYKNSEVLSVHTFSLWLLEFFWNTTTLNPVELMGICHLMSVVHAHFLL